MKNIIILALLVCSFGATAQTSTTPKSGNLTLSRSDIKAFLAMVETDMVGDTIDSAENLTFKKSCEDALMTKFSERTIKNVPAKFVKKLATNLGMAITQYEYSRRDVERLINVCVEWQTQTGDTALSVLNGNYIVDEKRVKAMVRKGKINSN